MAKRSTARQAVRSILSHTALAGLSAIFIIPFVWLVVTSVKSETHLQTFPPEWIPRGEYVRIDGRSWAEVVRNEVLEYAPVEYDEQGRARERVPLRSLVTLVDGWGEPLLEHLFDVPAGDLLRDLDLGMVPADVRGRLGARGVALPDDATLAVDRMGRQWSIRVEEVGYIIRTRGDVLQVYSDAPSRRLVPSQEIVTRCRPTFRHYMKGIRAFSFDLFLQNTLFIAVIAVIGTVLSSSWVAFGFSILHWPGRDKIFYLMLATMMLPPQVTMIPLFVIFKSLGWVNTYLPLLVPAFMGNAFFIFLLRQFFLTVPRDLIDAARVDGCSTFRIYWQIVLPLSVPALATVALFTFMGAWNDFMGPLLYVVDEAKYTLSLGLAMFKGRFNTRYGEMMAVSVMLTVPIIVLFFFTQKTFIQGIKTSGMKN